MNKIVKIQRIDGKLHIILPEGVKSRDLVNWLNDIPDKPQLEFEELPEKWTSAEWNDCDSERSYYR